MTTIIAIKCTDGSGDDGYRVELKKEPSTWEDESQPGHEISSVTQSGIVQTRGGGLACRDGAGGTSLMLNNTGWEMGVGDGGSADHQQDPAMPLETDWTWECTSVNEN